MKLFPWHFGSMLHAVALTSLLLDACGGAGPYDDGSPSSGASAGAVGPAGATGSESLSSLAAVSNEPPGANCATGGTRFETGLDTNRDGTLSADEVTSTQYV